MKIIIFILKKGKGAPGREPAISEEEQKKMMAFYFKKQEEMKVICLCRLFFKKRFLILKLIFLEIS